MDLGQSPGCVLAGLLDLIVIKTLLIACQLIFIFILLLFFNVAE
ncbi:hypothetical protein Gorai_003559 [Gossypium raimondii]|uniref:Uncharacterized protein n=1 Tax=Gossypium raimondii TaxID=29730 RepID=A0A7J8QQK0_GOSRA|nr:hypothetical protein [Gossypium raimondii]